jgi:hypothetical protein
LKFIGRACVRPTAVQALRDLFEDQASELDSDLVGVTLRDSLGRF